MYTAFCCCARHLQKVFFARGAFLLRHGVRSLARGDVSASASVMCARGSDFVPHYPSDGHTHERSPIGWWVGGWGGGDTAVCSVASRNWLRFAATPTRERVYGILVVVVYCGCGAWYYNR